VSRERQSGAGFQASTIEDSRNLWTSMIVQQSIDFSYCAIRCPSCKRGVQGCRNCQALGSTTPEPHVQRNAVPLDVGYIFDQQTNHPLPFPVRQSRILPDLPKISRQSKNLPALRVVQDKMVR